MSNSWICIAFQINSIIYIIQRTTTLKELITGAMNDFAYIIGPRMIRKGI